MIEKRTALAATLVVSAFGPYLAANLGIRTEQVVIYAFALGSGIHLLRTGRVERRAATLLALWLGIVAVAAASTLFPLRKLTGNSVAAGLDNLLVPLALLVILAIWGCNLQDIRDVVTPIQRTTVVMLSLNALVAFTMTVVDISEFLQAHFWSAGDQSIAGRIVKLGRYTGVFNSPFAAGIAYSVGLIALVHLHTTRRIDGWPALVAGALMVMGALLPASKMALLGGLPMALLLLASASWDRRAISSAVAAAAATLASGYALVSTGWWQETGQNMIVGLLEGDRDIFAARYAASSGVAVSTGRIWEDSPWVGAGAGVQVGPLDTSWLQTFAMSGAVGVALFLAFLTTMSVYWLRDRHIADYAWWLPTGAMLALAWGATIGGPSFMQNRAGALLMLNLVPMLMWRRPTPAEWTAGKQSPSRALPNDLSGPSRILDRRAVSALSSSASKTP